MVIISYDIHDDKLRNKFSKYLKKFGYRLQYSVFKIENSPRILDNITVEIKNKFSKRFSDCDSIIIFNLSNNCKLTCFGYTQHEKQDFIIVE